MAADPIDAFWAWWAKHETLLADAMHHGPEAWFIEPMGRQVAALGDGLSWNFGPGRHAQHHFALSAGGDPALRVVAERWRQRGPGDGPRFEFHTARQPAAQPEELAFGRQGGPPFAFADLRFDASPDEARQRFHLTVHHPLFDGLSEEARMRLAFLALDHSLGEDAVETWVGAVEAVEAGPPGDAHDVRSLVALVAEAPQRWPEPAWGMFSATDPDSGQALVLGLCTSAKFLDDPLFDTLVQVRFPYEADEEGMPLPEERERVTALWAAVEAELGDAVRSLCRQTGAGLRVEWHYVMGEGDAKRALEAMAAELPGSGVHTIHDPGWRALPA